MYNIAVIGAGQLGSRHLQGLAKLSRPCNIHIVDPFDSSIAIAKGRISEVGTNCNIREIFGHALPSTLPEVIDLAVIATTSDVRLLAMEALCASRSVKNLVLEKVLFQRFNEYEIAAQLIRRNSIKCWVNCPRRIYPVYGQLKTFFSDDPVKHMDINGGDWGLGCNGIHFLDLLAFLSEGKNIFSLSCDGLDAERRVSKRPGFVEFTGVLRGKYGEASLSLTSTHNSRAKHLITLRGERKSVVIDEAGGGLWQLDENGNRRVDFSLPYQSQLTGLVAESILFEGKCGLTPYEESAEMHLPFLRVLAEHGVVGELPALCALT